MLKVFAYVGSYRNNSSYTVNYIKSLISSLSEELEEEIELDMNTPSLLSIKECQGCMNCFYKEKCLINDDMEQLKNKMLQSDLIIFGTPVYLAQISGSMKTFIDRISYWTHLLRLTGKLGIAVNVSDTNGNQAAKDYLHYIMSYLGLSVIDDISIQMGLIKTEKVYNSLIKVEARKIKTIIESRNFPIDFKQEQIFKLSKQSILDRTDNFSEKKFWIENKYLEYNKFEDLFNEKCTYKKH